MNAAPDEVGTRGPLWHRLLRREREREGGTRSHGGRAVFGASMTQLLVNLSLALRFAPGDEVVVSQLDHEANIAPWLAMADRQRLVVKWWAPERASLALTPASLAPLLSPRTRFVACTHVSNVLGTVHDIAAIADAVHAVGALLCVDGVSFAPHRRVDVRALRADFYSFSWYKVRLSLGKSQLIPR